MQSIIKPVAYIRTEFKEKFGVPRQSGRAPSLRAKIVFEPEYRSPEALKGLEGFSHVWLIFDFSLCHKDKWSPTVRPPRLGGNKRVGVFASRSPFRPNHLGLSSVKLEEIIFIEGEGHVLIVSGADLVDMTPIYDIKPYLPFSDCHMDAVGGYAEEVKEHKLNVLIPPELVNKIPPNKLNSLKEVLSEDPRPSYQDDGREYGMSFCDMQIKFCVCENILTVTDIKK